MDRGRPTTTCDSSRRRERRRAGPNRTQDRRRALDRQREPLPTRVDVTPPLPAAYHRALDAGLQEIGVEVGSAQRRAIEGHVRLLLAWNQSIYLTASRDPEAVAIGHVIVGLEHQEAGKAAIHHRALLQRRPERLRHGGGMHATAGLSDVLTRPLVLVGVLGPEEGPAGAGAELGQEIPDLG